MRILILGSGGREHALAWRLSQDESCSQIYVWPGNDGIVSDKIIKVTDNFCKEIFINFVLSKHINLVIPSSETFLYQGVSDWCSLTKTPCFGPSKLASKLEGSKLFSKKLMIDAGIETSKFQDITEYLKISDLNSALEVIKKFKKPVLKLSGPALGKGVFVCSHFLEAAEVLNELIKKPLVGMEDGLFVEEAVEGKEISMFFACNDLGFSYLGSAQDHKRLLNDDKGPNTGGMGAVSPVPWAKEDFIQKVSEQIVRPTLIRMKEYGLPFMGILFLGLMVDKDKINLLEYNVRFGDPETQVILPLIEGDLAQFLYGVTQGSFSNLQIKDEFAVHVVKAAHGYPGIFGHEIEKDRPISLSTDQLSEGQFFFAGVKLKDNQLHTNGGRVLGVTSWGTNLESARMKAYEAINLIHFDGEQYRSDIGAKL
jgi:phosphoribosylamine--glycine ligase